MMAYLFLRANLFCSHNIIPSILLKYSLIIEHGKTNVFHFSRLHRTFNPPPFNLTPILTIKYMKLLGNSTRGINPLQKRRLYRCCILFIALYEFQLWYYNKAPMYYHLNVLRKMQWRAALWITGVFQMSPTLGVEVIAGLIPIYLHLKKLYGRFLLWQSSFPSNHIIHSILSTDRMQEHKSHNASIDHLMAKQKSQLKSSIINVNDKHNQCFPSFSFFNKKFKPGNNLEIILLTHFQIVFLFTLILWTSKSTLKN